MAGKIRMPREIGATGLRYVSGRVIEDELIPDLKFPLSITTYQRMKSDPIIAGSLFMIKQFLRKVDWDVRPKGGLNDSTETARQRADQVKSSLFNSMDRSFDSVMSDICGFIENGFGFFEPTYKVVDGEVVWKDFASRPPLSVKDFVFDKKGYVTAIEQYIPANSNPVGSGSTNISTVEYATVYSTATKKIPYSRLLHFRTDSEKNNPLGRSVLKNAYKAWYFKTKLEEHEAIGVEREMNGIPYLGIPGEFFNIDDGDAEALERLNIFKSMLSNLRNNEQAGILLPSDRDEGGHKLYEFELVASKGTRALDTSKIIERYDYRIAQSLLSDFLLMGSTSTGSFALSDNKVNTFFKSLEAYLEIIAEQFNRRAIPKLFELNGWDKEDMCELIHKPVANPTLSEIGKYLQDISSYVTPDKTLENALRAQADLPERDEANLYISTPTGTAQAISQRIGMMNSAMTSDSDQMGDGSDDEERGAQFGEPDQDTQEVVDDDQQTDS